MSTKHTPGPWKIEYHNGDDGESNGQWYSVGPARVWFPYNAGRGREDAAKADAHLIAAAPKLLETCHELREACAAAMRVIVADTSLIREFQAEMDRTGIEHGFGARATEVIAEAEGKRK